MFPNVLKISAPQARDFDFSQKNRASGGSISEQKNM
jgi:hypothetical protein